MKETDLLKNFQTELDSAKNAQERNELGQYATPIELARQIARVAHTILGRDDVSFLEPSIGLGTFYAAFLDVFGDKGQRALGFEVDRHYGEPAQQLWKGKPIEIHIDDFLKQNAPSQKYDCIITNPPYVRHHHIDKGTKLWLKDRAQQKIGVKVSGLTGLYCYFMLLSDEWLSEGGLSCWLVPTEFLDVNYGSAVKTYLTDKVELIRIHRFQASEVIFSNALVSSCVVFFRNRKPKDGHSVEFSWGSDIEHPSGTRIMTSNSLRTQSKWTKLFTSQDLDGDQVQHTIGDFFTVKRGLVTGDNDFFIMDNRAAEENGIPQDMLRPIIPSPRHLTPQTEEIGEETGSMLFICDMSREVLRKLYPSVLKYIERGEAEGRQGGYICSRRTPWYRCPTTSAGPIIIPYMGREGAGSFRFILNEHHIITANTYLHLLPKKEYAQMLEDPHNLRCVWRSLRSIPQRRLLECGRVYGGGLHKMEPCELMAVPAEEIAEIFNEISSGNSSII